MHAKQQHMLIGCASDQGHTQGILCLQIPWCRGLRLHKLCHCCRVVKFSDSQRDRFGGVDPLKYFTATFTADLKRCAQGFMSLDQLAHRLIQCHHIELARDAHGSLNVVRHVIG